PCPVPHISDDRHPLPCGRPPAEFGTHHPGRHVHVPNSVAAAELSGGVRRRGGRLGGGGRVRRIVRCLPVRRCHRATASTPLGCGRRTGTAAAPPRGRRWAPGCGTD